MTHTFKYTLELDSTYDIEKALMARGFSAQTISSLLSSVEVSYEEIIPYISEAGDVLFDGLMAGKKIFIEADVDTDGAMAGIQLYDKGMELGGNVTLTIPPTRNHEIEESVFERTKGADIVVFVDRGSNSLAVTSRLAEHCTVIVLDHHKWDPGDRSHMLFVNSVNFPAFNRISGGMLVTFMCMYLSDKVGLVHTDITCGCATLISDICDFSDIHNRALLATGFTQPVAPILSLLSKNKELSVRTVGFNIAPKINAMMRADKTAEILQMLCYPSTRALSAIDKVRKAQSDLLANVKFDVNTRMDRTRLLMLKDPQYKNYAGVLASSNLEDTAFVLIKMDDCFKGSFRAASNSFQYRQTLLDAGFHVAGHEAAFGITVKNMQELERLLRTANDMFPVLGQQHDFEIDSFDALMDYDLDSIAEFNRFCNNTLRPINFKFTGLVKRNIFSKKYIVLNIDGIEVVTNSLSSETIIFPIKVDEDIKFYKL